MADWDTEAFLTITYALALGLIVGGLILLGKAILNGIGL